MTARILIVDDVPANTRLLEAKLSAEYYQVASARDGFEALAAARNWQPDLILLDVMMPGMDGFECCRKLKEDPATLHIPVVMVTALGEAAERVAGLGAGADDFLSKPVEYATLMMRVRSLVRLKRLLDEWRARGETVRALGLAADRLPPPSVAGARAMVVDDWDAEAETIRAALGQDGIVVLRARDRAEAMALSAATPLDLILLSLGLTEEDPLALASGLRAADITHDVPLLLVGDVGERERLHRGFELGANDWLLLPLDPQELRVRARNQIRRKLYQDRLRADLGEAIELAVIDPLTGLYNRRYLMRHLRSMMDQDPPPHLSLMLIDVDFFKAVNDAHGHAAGDRALRVVAETLRSNIRAFDTLARYGGEEFVVIMPGAGQEQASQAAERLRDAVAGMLTPVVEPAGSGALRLTVSIGVAVSGLDADSADGLLAAADGALYAAKRSGRNRVELAREPWPAAPTA
ncbi:MAG TPA: PleD family two-component system response regulator [Acetobacteraceae bacterium]|nr:PleD family two-component system response regulator [Acetobacteraceae bacterium]